MNLGQEQHAKPPNVPPTPPQPPPMKQPDYQSTRNGLLYPELLLATQSCFSKLINIGNKHKSASSECNGEAYHPAGKQEAGWQEAVRNTFGARAYTPDGKHHFQLSLPHIFGT